MVASGNPAEGDFRIVLNKVTKNYGGVSNIALNEISLTIDKGELLFIAGASGAGKSTILKLLYGIETPSSGTIAVGNFNLLKKSDLAKVKAQASFIFQDYRLVQRRSVIDNVALPLVIRGVKLKDSLDAALAALQIVGLKNKASRLPRELSGGEQQRVAIARALVQRPQLLLADEPTGNLDYPTSVLIFELLSEINRLGTTVVIASHDLNLIEESKRRAIILDGGSKVGDFIA